MELNLTYVSPDKYELHSEKDAAHIVHTFTRDELIWLSISISRVLIEEQKSGDNMVELTAEQRQALDAAFNKAMADAPAYNVDDE